jgi:hypothetical protein
MKVFNFFLRNFIWWVSIILVIPGIIVAFFNSFSTNITGSPNLRTIFQESGVNVRETDIACDKSGRVIMTWYANQSESTDLPPAFDTIYMSIKAKNGAWTPLYDLLFNDARFPTLAIGNNGQLHLFFRRGRCLMHMQSLDSSPSKPSDWSDPKCITETKADLSYIDAVTSLDGNLHLVYSLINGDVYYRQSSDQGVNWSTAVLLPGSGIPASSADASHIAVDDKGRIHIVWSAQPQPFDVAIGVFYSRSEDNGETWQPEIQLAGRSNLEPNLITSSDNIVHVVWNGNVGVSKRFHRWSKDGGQTWSATEVIGNSQGGILGAPGIGVDTEGRVHVLMSTDRGALYNVWQNGAWKGQEFWTDSGQVSQAGLCISQGNIIEATFQENTERIINAELVTDAPSISTQEYSKTYLTKTPDRSMIHRTPTSLFVQSDKAILEKTSQNGGNVNISPGLPLLVSLLSVLGVIILVFIYIRLRKG